MSEPNHKLPVCGKPQKRVLGLTKRKKSRDRGSGLPVYTSTAFIRPESRAIDGRDESVILMGEELKRQVGYLFPGIKK